MVHIETWDSFFFPLLGLPASLAATAVLRILLRSRPRVFAFLATLRQRLLRLPRCLLAPAENNVGPLVAQHLIKAKVEQFRLLLQGLCCGVLVYSLLVLSRIARRAVRRQPLEMDLMQVLLQSLLALPSLFPGLVSPRSLDFFFGTSMVFVVAMPLANTGVHLPETMMCTNMAAALLLLVRRTVRTQRAPLFGLMVALYAGSTVAAVWLKGAFINVFGVASLQAAFCLCTCFVAHMLEQGLERSMLSSLQLQEVKELHSAASALLSSCCEVVVDLDNEGRIATQAPDLGSFLLRGPSQSMKGRLLAELITDAEERQRFTGRLQEPKKDMGIAENMPATMRDAYNNPLRLELLWFQYHKLDGQQHFKVGIREYSDSSTQQRKRPSADVFHQFDRCEHLQSATTVISDASLASGGSSEEPAVVVLDCSPDAAGFPVQALTDGFCVRVGRLPVGSDFLRCVRHPEKFTRWVQSSVNERLAGQAEGPDYLLTLRLPQGRVSAICRMPGPGRAATVEEGHCGDSAFDSSCVPLVLYQVRRCEGAGDRRPVMRGTPSSGNAVERL